MTRGSKTKEESDQTKEEKVSHRKKRSRAGRRVCSTSPCPDVTKHDEKKEIKEWAGSWMGRAGDRQGRIG